MKRSALSLGLAVATLALPAQAKLLDGGTNYLPPDTSLEINNVRDFESSYDATWKAVVAYLSDTSFVIDNIDKDSGLITISFSAPDPTMAIDCGHWSTWVKNLRGRRDYAYDGAAAFAQYELLDKGTLINMERSLSLSGKFNILVTSPSPTASRVKVTARYVPSVSLKVAPLAFDSNFQRVVPRTFTETFSFSTGSEARVPGAQTICRATGSLETNLLAGVSSALGK